MVLRCSVWNIRRRRQVLAELIRCEIRPFWCHCGIVPTGCEGEKEERFGSLSVQRDPDMVRGYSRETARQKFYSPVLSQVKTAANSPRPSVQQFRCCCRAEFAFLNERGFHEVSADVLDSPDPYRFGMASGLQELLVHGIECGLHAWIVLRDAHGSEVSLNGLFDTSRRARRLVRRRHPDGKRAEIAATAQVLRDYPEMLAATDLSRHDTARA